MVALNGIAVPVVLDDEALTAIAEALPDRDGSAWLCGASAAAAYLGLPSRKWIYAHLYELPHHRAEGGRLWFRRDELDAFVKGCRER